MSAKKRLPGEKEAIDGQVAEKLRLEREEQIGRVMQSTVGMYGDRQGIAGKTLQEQESSPLSSIILMSPSSSISFIWNDLI
ncbi:MAG: hypothetical protein HW390_2743 [Candidatus Brocadiaceae bacterium]|nr:hypothetical protein [Candidatus Brocadiaceae bacterium]